MPLRPGDRGGGQQRQAGQRDRAPRRGNRDLDLRRHGGLRRHGRALASQLGDSVNIYPVKGYSITVNLPDAASRAAPVVSLLDDETKLVTSRLGDDRFRVAGTAEFNGYNKDIRADRIRPLIEWVQQCFPGVSTRSVVPWAGLRPMMPDMLPRVGRGNKPCVFYNTGHGHLLDLVGHHCRHGGRCRAAVHGQHQQAVPAGHADHRSRLSTT